MDTAELGPVDLTAGRSSAGGVATADGVLRAMPTMTIGATNRTRAVPTTIQRRGILVASLGLLSFVLLMSNVSAPRLDYLWS